MNNQASVKSQSAQYPHASSAFQVGPVELANRIVFPAWQVNYANTDGSVSDKLMAFHTKLAQGGCGLIFTGCATVTADGLAFDRVMRIDKDDYLPGYKKLFATIAGLGVVPGIQLVHYGRQSSTSVSGDVLMAPSAIPCPVMSQYDPKYQVREMTLEDIAHVRQAFIAAAARAVEAGARVIEVHAAHGYLLSEFMSPYSNKRTDAYGGSVENRVRLIVEIIAGIRAKLQDSVAISVRINGDDFVAGGLKPADYEAIAPMLEQAGADMFNVAAGVYESMERIVPPASLGEAPHVDIARQVKAFARVPVCMVGAILSLEVAETIIAGDKADLCAMGRAQVADPEIVRKSFTGRQAEIRPCEHCNSCTFWTTGDPQMFCAVNPDYQKS